MIPKKDTSVQKGFLQRVGHTKEELDSLDEESLIKMYEKEARQTAINFQQYMSEDSFVKLTQMDQADIGVLKEQIKTYAHQTLELIRVLRDGFMDFPYNDVADMLMMSAKNISTHKLQRILRIAFREFQETLLHSIATELKELPIEEYKTVMNHYEQIRSDTQKLKSTIKALSDEVKKEQILNMAHFKLQIIQECMPTAVFNETYEEYLNNKPEKLKLVEEILSLTKMYSKYYLKHTPIEELQTLKEAIIEDRQQDERDKKIFKQYTQMLNESMYGGDDGDFSEVCTKIITNLNQKQILMIQDYMDNKNPIFTARFNTLLHDLKKNPKK